MFFKIAFIKSLCKVRQLDKAILLLERDSIERNEYFYFLYLIGKTIVKYERNDKFVQAENALNNAFNLGTFKTQVKSTFYLAQIYLENKEMLKFHQFYRIARDQYKKEPEMEQAYKKYNKLFKTCFFKQS